MTSTEKHSESLLMTYSHERWEQVQQVNLQKNEDQVIVKQYTIYLNVPFLKLEYLKSRCFGFTQCLFS